MSKKGKIKILFAEDLPTDVDLARWEISRVFPEIEAAVVDTEHDFMEKLKEFSPDLVISDYLMPGFDGMRVIELVLKNAPELPVIILTGSMNEDTAAECMKAGAIDYVIKEHMARLPYAVVEALEKKEIKIAKEKAEKALIESEKKFRLLAEKANDLIYRYELYPEEGFSYVSPASVRITGYTPDNFYKDPDLITRIVHSEDRDRLLNITNYYITHSEQRETLTMRWVRKDGKVVWIEQQNVRIFDDNEKLIALEGIARDVTERHEAAEEPRGLLLNNNRGFRYSDGERSLYRIPSSQCEPVILEDSRENRPGRHQD